MRYNELLDMVELIARMTPSNECGACGLPAADDEGNEIGNAECDDHGPHELDACDSIDTVNALIHMARRIIEVEA